jgi:hypothetical protein
MTSYNNDLNVVNFFLIPFSFFFVIFTLFIIQSIIVRKTSNHIGMISFNHPPLFQAMNWWGVFVHELSHAFTAFITLNKIKEFKCRLMGGMLCIQVPEDLVFFNGWLFSEDSHLKLTHPIY